MGESFTSKYVKLSSRIHVPVTWHVRGIETFLLKLAETVIGEVTSDRLIILQVGNVPTMLAQREENYETQYFFEIISRSEFIEAYIIDVIFLKTDMLNTNFLNAEDLPGSSAGYYAYISTEETSLDDYNIITYQSDRRTAYYLIPAEQNVQTSSPERRTNCEPLQYSACPAKRRAMSYDILLLLTTIGIAGLAYIVVINIIQISQM